MTAETFAEAVAMRCGVPVDQVEAALVQHGVTDAPAPPPARPLRLRRLKFSGVKTVHGESSDIAFDWETGQDGVWGIASDDNFTGKSSILQIALWAIRGAPKSLTGTVRGWLRRVEAELDAGNRPMQVSFEVTPDGVRGAVDLLSARREVTRSLPFDSDDGFKHLMSDLMLDALDLEPIAAAQASRRGDGKVQAYADRWLAYTGAMLFDSDSNALVGEQVGADLTQRLLQVFLGLPWATTLFRARAAARTRSRGAAVPEAARSARRQVHRGPAGRTRFNGETNHRRGRAEPS